MVEELREAGVVVDDGELSVIVLNGLDTSYDPFVTSQMTRVEDIPFASLLGLVRLYEARIERFSEFKGTATANVIQSHSSSFSSSTIICQICEKKGHTTIYCFNLTMSKSILQNKSQKGVFDPTKTNRNHQLQLTLFGTQAAEHPIMSPVIVLQFRNQTMIILRKH